jgi:hypothetical protein
VPHDMIRSSGSYPSISRSLLMVRDLRSATLRAGGSPEKILSRTSLDLIIGGGEIGMIRQCDGL